MIDAQEHFAAAGGLPMGRYAMLRELQQFERMSVGIAELEGGDAARSARQALRPGRRDRRPTRGVREALERRGHVGDDDGEMLEARIGGGEVGGIGGAGRIELQKLDRLASETERHALRAAANAERTLEVRAGAAFARQQPAAEGVPVEVQQAIGVAGRQAETGDAPRAQGRWRAYGHAAPRRLRNMA